MSKHGARLHDERGLALEGTLLVLVLMSAILMAAVSGVTVVTRTANYDYRGSRVFYAAEGGAEAVMAQLADALEDGALSDEELAAIQPPTLTGFTFTDVTAQRVGAIEIETITDGPYAGLYSLTQRVDITTEARDELDNSSSIIVSAKAQAIPIFQFGVFFEQDLEVTNGPAMEFAGWVHSNGNIYMSSNNAWYRDVITTPNQMFWQRKDKNLRYNGVYVNDASGNEVQLDFDSRSHPTASAFRAHSDMYYDNRIKTNAYSVDSLKVPLPEGMQPIVVTQPRDAADNDLVRKAKFAWKADWYIEIDLAQLTQSSADDPNELCQSGMIQVRGAGLTLPSQGECMQIFEWTFEAFYEGRELRNADVLDIDMRALGDWSGASLARTNQILYVTFINTPAVTGATDGNGDGFYPVVRFHNGRRLTGGALTMATDRPIYVQGDYNVDAWVPAAVVGDAITLLSNNWNDANQQQQFIVRRTAADTQYLMAILAGHSATACDWMLCGTNPYGGGLENYPRFLEKWKANGVKKVAMYRGSLVSLHQSVYATGQWSGAYYKPPNRDWGFEVRFEDPQNLPPGTPTVGNVIRTAFRPVY